MHIRKFSDNLVNKADFVHNFLNVYVFSLHISGDYVPIIRRNNCIYATMVFVWWLSGMHTRQSSTQSAKCQVSHKYICFSWWWAHSLSKHLQKRNRHTNKNCAPSWQYLQDYTGLRNQQNLKFSDICSV